MCFPVNELFKEDTLEELPRQGTLKSPEVTTGTFSEGNPFAGEAGDHLPPPPSQQELDSTLVSPDNPFSQDMLGAVAAGQPQVTNLTANPG